MKIDLDSAIKEIKRIKAKKVLIQLPDGLKPKATEIIKKIESKTNAKIFIWAGSCFGSCDIPNAKNFDLILQFGHTKWPFWK
jgi:2-(3-amino-3-carboxypropyl)histidine synthase